MRHTFLSALALLAMGSPGLADETEPSAAEEQFAMIVSWEGRWAVAETDALQIVFEKTARGTTMVERWETQSGLHSMTVYHLDGDTIVATHYCPQGNQPRLASHGTAPGEVHFTFHDVTDLDPGESHTQELWFEVQEDGAIRRSEMYLSEEGPGEPSHYTLRRVDTAN